MPLSFTAATGGTAYADIRVGDSHNVHQVLLDVAALAALDDADGFLPPGLPVLAAGGPVTGAAQTVFGVIGPEPVKMGAANHYGNVFLDGALNRDMIEDNLGAGLSANQVSALAEGGFKLV